MSRRIAPAPSPPSERQSTRDALSTAPSRQGSAASLASDELLHKVFDIMDIQGSGKVSAADIGSFMSTFLWEEPGLALLSTKRDSASKVLERITDDLLQHHERDGPDPDSAFAGGKAKCMVADEMSAWLEKVDKSEDLFQALTRTDLIADVLLLRQLLCMDYGDSTVLAFSLRDFGLNLIWFWALPVTFLIARRIQGGGGKSRVLTTLKNVRMFMLQRWLHLVTRVPLANRVPERWMQALLQAILFLLWGCVLACLIGWFALYGPYLRDGSMASGFEGFVTLVDPRTQVGFFNAVVPVLMLGALVMGGAAKLSIKDSESVGNYAVVVSDLGSLDQPITVSSTQQGQNHWTVRTLLNEMKAQVAEELSLSFFRKALDASVMIIPLMIAAAHVTIRKILTGNAWSSNTAFGPAVEVMLLYCVTLLMTVWWSEIVEIVQFLIKQQLLAERYSKLFSHGEAAVVGLPCLKNRYPENLVLWARLRFYLQKPNVIEMRWVELFLVGVLMFVILICGMFVVALFLGDLFTQRLDARNTDLQTVIVFCIPIMICLMCWILFVIFSAVNIGNVYRNDLIRLTKEAFDVECYISSMIVRADSNALYQRHHAQSTFGSMRNRVPAAWQHDTGKDMRKTPLPAPASIAATNAAAHGVSHGACQPTLADVKQYQQVVEKLTAMLTLSNEYIEVFGVAIDTKFRNTMFSLIATGIVAIVSSVASLIARKLQS